MIKGLGTDIVDIRRIEAAYKKFGRRFLEHFLRGPEIEAAPKNPRAYIAGRFAAKEAAAKALGLGFSQGISPLNMEIGNGPAGGPELALHGAALRRAGELQADRFFVSISHERDYATAIVIIEGKG